MGSYKSAKIAKAIIRDTLVDNLLLDANGKPVDNQELDINGGVVDELVFEDFQVRSFKFIQSLKPDVKIIKLRFADFWVRKADFKDVSIVDSQVKIIADHKELKENLKKLEIDEEKNTEKALNTHRTLLFTKMCQKKCCKGNYCTDIELKDKKIKKCNKVCVKNKKKKTPLILKSS